MNEPATIAQPVPSVLCPACSRPVRVIERPPQPHRRLTDHGQKIGVLCPGSGKTIEPLQP